MTASVTKKFNAELGASLPDETKIMDLTIPSITGLDPETRGKISRVSSKLRHNYSRALYQIVRRFGTVGEIRRANPMEIYITKGVGKNTGQFLLNAFRPLSETEQD